MSTLKDVLASFRFAIDESEPQPLEGLSNRNYLVRSDGAEYVVRVATGRAERFGICREAEAQALQLASDAGLGAEVVRFALPEGHLITKRIPNASGVGNDPERYRTPEAMRRVTEGVKRIHALPAIAHAFDPIDRIRKAFRRAIELDIPLPAGFERALTRLDDIEAWRGDLAPDDTALCHNDLFGGNVLDCDPVRFVDWEFAGMGDVFFDLATLAVACDEFDPLPEDLLRVILETYFSSVAPDHVRRLTDMIFVVQLHVVAWGLTHHVLGTPAAGWAGFTYLGFATDLLEHLLSEANA